MPAEILDLPLKKLKLDPNNVRFHHFANRLSDAQIEEEIWKESDTRDLFREILNSRGLSEPPIVDSSLVVMEGNRRLVCLRKLSERTHNGEYPQMPENTFDSVTCYVLPKDTSQKDIAILLGRLHVSGKKEWKALNQAAHIYELFNKHGASQADITNLMSMSKSTVGHMIKAFQLTTDYGFYARVKDMVERLNDVPREELVEAGTDPVKLEALQKLRDTVDEVLRNVAAIKQR